MIFQECAVPLNQYVKQVNTTFNMTWAKVGMMRFEKKNYENATAYLKLRFLKEKWTSTIPVVFTLVRRMSWGQCY